MTCRILEAEFASIQQSVIYQPHSIPLIDSNDMLNSSHPASTFGFGSPVEFLMQLGLSLYLFTGTMQKGVRH
jgi:hypothetical protein